MSGAKFNRIVLLNNFNAKFSGLNTEKKLSMQRVHFYIGQVSLVNYNTCTCTLS